jgi:cytochrome c556
MSPFQPLYGYHPPSITIPLKGTTNVQAMEDHIWNQQEGFKLLKDNLVMAQNRMKQQEHKHLSEMEFEVGDWVLLMIQPYK